MDSRARDRQRQPRSFPARVARVVDPRTVIIDRGRRDGVQPGQLFQLYSLAEADWRQRREGGSQEQLRVIRGTGEVIAAGEGRAVLRSTRSQGPLIVTRPSPLRFLGVGPELVVAPDSSADRAPFDDPVAGDLALPLD